MHQPGSGFSDSSGKAPRPWTHHFLIEELNLLFKAKHFWSSRYVQWHEEKGKKTCQRRVFTGVGKHRTKVLRKTAKPITSLSKMFATYHVHFTWGFFKCSMSQTTLSPLFPSYTSELSFPPKSNFQGTLLFLVVVDCMSKFWKWNDNCRLVFILSLWSTIEVSV